MNIDTIHFPALPKLDAIVEQRLLQLTEDNQRSTAPTSLQAYEQQYLASAEKRNSSYLQAKVREQHDGLVIIELSSYLTAVAPTACRGAGSSTIRASWTRS